MSKERDFHLEPEPKPKDPMGVSMLVRLIATFAGIKVIWELADRLYKNNLG